MNLTILGSALPAGGIHGGPALCQANPDGNPNPSQCYQPSAANVLNVSVAETPPHTTLAISNPALTLAAQTIFTEASGAGDESACTNAGGTWIDTGMPPYCQSKARMLIISNSGAVTAMDVNYTIAPALPAGTMVSPASCGNIPAGGSCELTVTPGNTPSAAADVAPVPSVLTAQGSNTPTAVTSGIVVLTYGNRYQGGFVFAIDDSTADTMSVGGKVAAFEDQADPFPDGIIWSSNGNSGNPGDAVFDSIWGIDETSTTASPSPNESSTQPATQLAGQENCNGATDGQCNTNNILIFYSSINPNFYAAGRCSATIAGFNDWYLPAVCEMGFDAIGNNSGCGPEANPTLQNMQSNLVDNGNVGSLTGFYWSSTEFSNNPQNVAWVQSFATGGDSVQIVANKDFLDGVRCVRAF